jgi:hypothetical protein
MGNLVRMNDRPIHHPNRPPMNQTPEELAEQLAKRLAIEHLPHPFELSALPLILSAIQSATKPLVHRVKELEEQLAFLSVCATENANLHTDKATLTAENAELRKLLRAVLDEHNKGMCEDSEFGNSNGPYMPPSITLRIRQAIDQARNQ